MEKYGELMMTPLISGDPELPSCQRVVSTCHGRLLLGHSDAKRAVKFITGVYSVSTSTDLNTNPHKWKPLETCSHSTISRYPVILLWLARKYMRKTLYFSMYACTHTHIYRYTCSGVICCKIPQPSLE
jgi:hypothetical protein